MKVAIFLFLISISTTSLASISFDGVPPAVQQKFQNQVDHLRKNPTDYAVLDNLLVQLMETGLFESTEAVQGKKLDDITIVARALRRITEIEIVGNSVLPKDEIIKVLQLNVGDGFDRKRIYESTQRLKDKYSDLGNMNTIITVDFKVQAVDKIAVTFKVSEGAACFINAIRFETRNTYLIMKLNKIARSVIKQQLSSQKLSDLQAQINEHFITNRYLNSSLSTPQMEFTPDFKKVNIVYQVNDPYRYDLIFKGNSPLNRDEALIAAISPENSAQLGFNLAPEATSRVRNYYLNRGYAYINVTSQLRQVDESFRKEIHLLIEEGPRVKINKFIILGQTSRPPQYYSDFIRQHSSELVSQGYYNEKDIEKGYKNLVTELRNQGFFRAKIQTTNVIETSSKQTVDLQISLYEGPLTEIENIDIIGNSALTDADLMTALEISKGGPLHLNKLESTLENIRKFYFDRGYLEMQILGNSESLVSYNQSNTKAIIRIKVQEGPKVIVNAIVVDGTQQTKNSVILRELDFKVNEPLTPDKIESSISSLQRLGLFNKIEIDTLEKGSNIGNRTVIVRVLEKNPGLFKFGIGLTNDVNLNIRGYIGASYRNLAGSARSISLRIEQNKAIIPLNGRDTLEFGEDYLENKITAGYYEPFLFNPHIDGRVNITRSQKIIEHPNLKLSSPKTVVFESNSVDFLLEKNFTSKIKLTWQAYGYAQEKQFFVYELPKDDDTLNVARIGPTLDVDYRDDAFNPGKGQFFRFNFDYSDPVFGSSETVHFIKFTTSYSHYLPFRNSGWVWANSLRGGYVANLSNAPYVSYKNIGGVPYQHTFTLGSRSTIRGFNPATESIPRVDELYKNLRNVNGMTDLPNLSDFTASSFRLTSSSHFYLIKSEIRFPLYGSLGGVIFYDGGAVIIPNYQFDKPYRQSAGVGLRVNTPVGPVNFELAYKLDTIDEDDTLSTTGAKYQESKYQFHFSIGSF